MFAEGGSTNWLLVTLGIISIPALVILNGLFVAAEFALVAVRRTRIEELAAQGVRGAKAVQSALNHLDRSIAATQLGITLASIGLGFIGEPALSSLIEPLFDVLPPEYRAVAKHTVAATLAFALITFMHVVFGELIPKSLALQIPDKTALWVARPLRWFIIITRPVIVLMNGVGNTILRWMGFNPQPGEGMVHSVEELSLLIEDTEEAGVLDEVQADVVQNVIRFSDRVVKDCMIPREKMASLELHQSPDKILEAVRTGAHTRMPVYDGELDEIVGIVNTKDLFYLFSVQGVVVLQDAMYPPIYLKPEEALANALRLFRKAKRHMALVRDPETERIVGLITLEDILEEIVGELEDEHDAPVLRWRRKVLKMPIRPGTVPVQPPRPANPR